MKKLGFVGTGKMASAIVSGLLKGGFSAQEIAAYNPNPVSLSRFSNQFEIAGFEAPKMLVESCQFVVLAVKPQMFDSVLADIADFFTPKHVVISIAAGISEDYLRQHIPNTQKFVLAMPNTPMMVGFGAVSMACSSAVTAAEFDLAKSFFANSALVCPVDSHSMSNTIPLHGSSPAMFYQMAALFEQKAADAGLDTQTAHVLFCQAMIGAAQMMLQTGKSNQELIDMVCSKGGTTLAMLDALSKSGFENALSNGFDACINRALELGR